MIIPSLLKRWASLEALLASAKFPSPLCRLTYNGQETNENVRMFSQTIIRNYCYECLCYGQSLDWQFSK